MKTTQGWMKSYLLTIRRKENVVLLGALLFTSGLVTVHSYKLIGPSESFSGIFASFTGLLEGSGATDPSQTRLFIPVVLKLLDFVPLINAKRAILILEWSAAMFTFAMFSAYSRTSIAKPAYQVLALLAFSAAAVSSQTDIGRVGDLFNVGFFLAGLLSLRGTDTPFWPSGLPGRFGFLVLFAVFATVRYDITMVVLLIGFLSGLLAKDRNLWFLCGLAAVVSTIVFGSIYIAYGVHDLFYVTFITRPVDGYIRIRQVLFPVTWFTLGLFINILIIIPIIRWKSLGTGDKILLFCTLLYSVFLLAVGNSTEYRLWLPLIAILIILSTQYLEKVRALD